ncbi:MAG: hypothetical protein JWO67_7248 [Streptosporangiaceae bacterium]|nr:hypothetical protein [Streptosporangiaceae bacterium]
MAKYTARAGPSREAIRDATSPSVILSEPLGTVWQCALSIFNV